MAVPRVRKPTAKPAPAPHEPEDAESFAARANPADLDALVVTLPDAALAHLAIASARQLRRHIGRAAATRSRKNQARPGVLERAGQDLAREWAMPPEADEGW